MCVGRGGNGVVFGKEKGAAKEKEGGAQEGEVRHKEEGHRDCGDLQTSREIKWTCPFPSPGCSGLAVEEGGQ